jgi:nucleotide-binding universal stress UspA family protein
VFVPAGIATRTQAMTYTTLMVHLELGRSNAGLLRVTGDLAERFHADVIGIAGCQSMLTSYNDVYVPGDVVVQVRDESHQEIKEAEAEFRGALKANTGTIEWRSTVMSASLSEYIAHEARSADLVITSVNSGDLLDASRVINIGELLMQVGRPVLIVPDTTDKPDFAHIVVGWKDTLEARRAVSDALPLLEMAEHVTVVEIAAEEDQADAHKRVKDVGGWLKRHGVAAEGTVRRATGDDASQLNAIAHKLNAGVIVAGAYGHSRLREFVFGGVTRDLLRSTACCSLMSH